MPKPKRALRGSTQVCPKCGSDKVLFNPELKFKGYGPGIACCQNPACDAVWEAFEPEALPHMEEDLPAFKEPCNNCAFRKGSPEQDDPYGWERMLYSLANSSQGFHCHKGVPIEEGAEHGFAYPENNRKMRLCRGYLNYMFSKRADEYRKEAEEAHADNEQK